MLSFHFQFRMPSLSNFVIILWFLPFASFGYSPPGVTLKIALDSNGNIASSSATNVGRFTSPRALDMVHRLRRESDCVIIGANTVLSDNPSLTVRRGYEVSLLKQPARVVLDPRLRTLSFSDAKIYREPDAATIVYYSCESPNKSLMASIVASNPLVTFKKLSASDDNDKRIPPRAIIDDLKTRFKFTHMMLEGGGVTAVNFLAACVVDRAIIVKVANFSFLDPAIPSGITSDVLDSAGLRLHQDDNKDEAKAEDDNVLERWCRPSQNWPNTNTETYWP